MFSDDLDIILIIEIKYYDFHIPYIKIYGIAKKVMFIVYTIISYYINYCTINCQLQLILNFEMIH